MTTTDLIELYVQERGPCTIDEVTADLDVQLLAVYPAVSILADQNRIRRDGETLRSAR